MPRISRFAVQFPVAGIDWVATFFHQHDSKDGVAYTDPKSHKIIHVKHVTTCRISRAGAGFCVTGVSLCSRKDEYDWQLGIKRALQDALESAGLCEILEDRTVKALKPEYGEAMSSFFIEMKVKGYPPHQPINLTPVENRNGLAYAGCD